MYKTGKNGTQRPIPLRTNEKMYRLRKFKDCPMAATLSESAAT